jgi:hypothetical protein
MAPSSPPPSPPGGAALDGDPTIPVSRKQTPTATPASAPTLNPFAALFVLAGASSSQVDEPLADWLHLSPSSSLSNNGDGPPPKRGKGKAPMAEIPPLQVDAPWPRSDFMVAARDAYRRPTFRVRCEVVSSQGACNIPCYGLLNFLH